MIKNLAERLEAEKRNPLWGGSGISRGRLALAELAAAFLHAPDDAEAKKRMDKFIHEQLQRWTLTRLHGTWDSE